MSELVDRITAVLEAHWLHHDNRCRCDKSRRVLTGAEWQAHVAERVAEALHLKQTLIKEGEAPPLYGIDGWMRSEEKP